MVGRGEDEDALVAVLDAVELGEQGLHHAAQAAAAKVGALVADRVDLVEEEHARRIAASGVEDRPQLALALADVHVEHVDQADGIEPGAELPGNGAGDERLAAARRPVEQQAAAQALAVQPAQLGVAHRHQERALEPLLDLLHTGDVSQPDARLLDLAGCCCVPVVGVDEHRRNDTLEGLLGLAPVERGVGPRSRRSEARDPRPSAARRERRLAFRVLRRAGPAAPPSQRTSTRAPRCWSGQPVRRWRLR